MATTKKQMRKPLTKREALAAAKRAKTHVGTRVQKRGAAWKKGGREWERLLGHFGLAS